MLLVSKLINCISHFLFYPVLILAHVTFKQNKNTTQNKTMVGCINKTKPTLKGVVASNRLICSVFRAITLSVPPSAVKESKCTSNVGKPSAKQKYNVYK